MVGWRGEISLPLCSQIICFVPILWVNILAREVRHSLQPCSGSEVVAVRGKLFCLVQQKINHLQVLSFPQLDITSLMYALESQQRAGLLCAPGVEPRWNQKLGAACSAAFSDREALEHPLGSHLGHAKHDLKGVDG